MCIRDRIYDYFRLLYARIGIPHCPKCGRAITKQTIDQMVDTVMAVSYTHLDVYKRQSPEAVILRPVRGIR